MQTKTLCSKYFGIMKTEGLRKRKVYHFGGLDQMIKMKDDLQRGNTN